MPVLDFAQPPAQKQCPVQPVTTSGYAHWRAQRGALPVLRDNAAEPPEKILQAIWQHQRLRRDQLRTLDGQTVRVLHPGFGSAEGGPDFRNAVLRFGAAEPVSGDVEVDLRPAGWRAHGHDRNPAFQHVILHVVWDGAVTARQPVALALRLVLDAPLSELSLHLEHNSVRTLPENLVGKCCAPLRELDADALGTLLRDAAQVRMRIKAAQFQARAQQAGWEQSLWEGLFRALGYKHNVWPMQHLAEIRARWMADNPGPLQIQARLFGLSGLLPAELKHNRSDTDDYLRRVWDLWWREREEFTDLILPRAAMWRFHGLRPANHPQRRLALAAHWACDASFVERLEQWCEQSLPEKKSQESLARVFHVNNDKFWSWHWTFRSARLPKPQPLLGAQRVTDLAINVVLPWLLARAEAGRNEKLSTAIMRCYDTWPAAEDNSVLRLARQRLLGRTLAARSGLNTASAQQGLLQIVRDFCDHSPATCEGCQFPELVQQWSLAQRYDQTQSTSQ